MFDDRAQRLKYENDQRRYRDGLIESSVGPLAGWIRDCVFEYPDIIHDKQGNDVFALLQTLPIPENPEGFESIGYWDFDDTSAVLERLLLEADSIVGACWIRLDEGPFYLLDAKQCVRLVRVFGRHSDRLELVSEEFGHGFFVSHYIGHLPEGRRTNNDEIVYEVISWTR